MIVDSKSQPVALDNSTVGVTCAVEAKEQLAIIFMILFSVDFDFLALMRFDMTFEVTLRDDSVSVNTQIRVETSHFHFYW